METGIKLDFNFNNLTDGLVLNTKFFQTNIESITDPLMMLEFMKEWATLENALMQFVVSELEALKGKTPGASFLWLPQSTKGI